MAALMVTVLKIDPKLPWWYPAGHLTLCVILRLALMFGYWVTGYKEDE